ncbi:hypothetical protein ACS0TY_007657 [Phlomoides rotata]
MLATYVKQVLPNTNLKPEPHLTSQIIVWKKNYHHLFEILKHTVVGMDSTTKVVETAEEQWDTFMKKDPNARFMRHKYWLLYKDWCEIFDQSRVTSEGVESHVNADTLPPSISDNVDVDHGSYKVVDENQDES